ncbi:hypothetical protein TrVFT333_007555 [Trichoderma virens FT-333]|nr:hypothetical protein TrVFT333_007555 [Trichoderma virens FT-333]
MATEPQCLAGPSVAGPSTAASNKSAHQYQHFIPQFLLKNFSHKYVAPDYPDAARGRRRDPRTGIYSGEPVVNCLRLSDGFSLEECPARRACGLENMYEDTENPLKDYSHLENKFAALESTASLIYRKIIKTYKDGKDDIWLTRAEQDVLRKFMFLLTLRSVQYHRKFNLDSIQEYEGEDKGWLQEYMEGCRVIKPIDVWLQSLETIIDLEIDTDGKWEKFIKEAIYFPIGDMFVDYINEMYMTICTPDNHVEEFILTDNCCNVIEGRTPAYPDTNAVNHLDLAPCFHKFAPISPKLMIVLRSTLLPEPLDSANSVVTMWRQVQQQIWIDTRFGNGTKSLLEDLPIRKAKTTYMEEQLAYIKGLSQFMEREGREGTCKWTIASSGGHDLEQTNVQNVAAAKFLEDPNRAKDGTGGTTDSFQEDMAAAAIMLETWTMSVDLNYGSPEYEATCRRKLERLLEVATRALQSVQNVTLFVKEEYQGSEDLLAYAHSIIPDNEINVAMYKAFNESIAVVRGAGCGLESMGHFSLFGDAKWRIPNPASGQDEPFKVGKAKVNGKRGRKGKKTVCPAAPDVAIGKVSTESPGQNQQLDVKEKIDAQKAICSSQSGANKRKTSTGATKPCEDDKTKEEAEEEINRP